MQDKNYSHITSDNIAAFNARGKNTPANTTSNIAGIPLPTQEVDPDLLATMPPLSLPPNLKFGPFTIPSTQVFHLSQSRLSFGLVNLKPLLPGHILICPVRRVPRLSQLSVQETTDLFLTVRRVSRTLERLYSATSFNVAVQDGVDAGQSVPHVHVHVIPRRAKDMEAHGGGDAIYEMMNSDVGDMGSAMVQRWLDARKSTRNNTGGEFGGPEAEASRVGRSESAMKTEADWLRIEMEKDSGLSDEGDYSSLVDVDGY